MRLKDRVIVLTGAAGAGIGQTTARKYASEGAKIVLSDTHEKRTQAAAEAIEKDFGVEAIGVLCDVRDKDEVEALMAAGHDAPEPSRKMCPRDSDLKPDGQ